MDLIPSRAPPYPARSLLKSANFLSQFSASFCKLLRVSQHWRNGLFLSGASPGEDDAE